MKYSYKRQGLVALLASIGLGAQAAPLQSIQTPYTISKVRVAQMGKKQQVVGSSYEGAIVCYTMDGQLQWEHKLSGYFNQDVFCADLDGDQRDEVLAANSDGTLYCLSDQGELRWKFRPNSAVMNAVTVIHKEGKPYVACGGYDTKLYYLNAQGKQVGVVDSRSYSQEKGYGIGGPTEELHIANFLRTARRADGSEVLVLHGAINSMAARGGAYLFEPLATQPFHYIFPKKNIVYGAMSIDDSDPHRGDRLLLGSTKTTREGYLSSLSLDGKQETMYAVHKLGGKALGSFGYRVAQAEVMQLDGKTQPMILFGSNILLPGVENTKDATEVLTTKYSYWDMTKDHTNSKLILASAQSGGNCIHILDLTDPNWKAAYEGLRPVGNMKMLLDGHKQISSALSAFTLPAWEQLANRPKVYFMSENPDRPGKAQKIIQHIHAKYPSPVFLGNGQSGGSEDPKLWSRDTMSNAYFKAKRDKRQKYTNNQAQILKNTARAYTGDSKGMAMWGGHGNDPFYYSPQTTRKILDLTQEEQQTVLIFPEMEGRGEDMAWLMNDHFYPLADYARSKNSKFFIRSKHIFWLGNVYEPHWNKLVSGEYADVFIPSMEETTDKSMELSVMGRMGMWMSGAVNSWGSRCARDNASYDRLRQHSHQNLPNHFLRNMVYHISLGAQYLDNFPVDQQYMSLLWELIAKGLLYVPQREEIVSVNPVHLSIVHPNQQWLEEGNNVKWVCYYDEQKENANPWVMGRLNGSWPAAPTTEWDFSRYAAGAKERRLNFISSYNYGHVLLTPPADEKAVRGHLEDHMHPLYKGKTKAYFTDGRYYYRDASMKTPLEPQQYYKEVESAIHEGAKLLPLTVKGEVGWVAAQSAPKHIRVTVIDGGYLNPSTKQATLEIGAAKVKSITDLITGKRLKVEDGACQVTIPCGMFTFLDVELAEAL